MRDIFAKISLSAAVIGMLSAPINMPLMAQNNSPANDRIAPDSPVNCSIFNQNIRPVLANGVISRARPVPRSPSVAPPPSIPAPPPPPSSPAQSAPQEVVVTGTRGAGAADIKLGDALGKLPALRSTFSGHSKNNEENEEIAAPDQISTLPVPDYRYPRPIVQDNEKYAGEEVASVKRVANEPVSTFSVDVDTGSYSNVRRFLNQAQLPPKAAVRSEEMINYFRYDYPLPKDREQPFSVTTDMAKTPWNKDTHLLRIGLRGYDIDRAERPSANLVFLVDVSGSMRSAQKLPLVKQTLLTLSNQLRADDKVSIVVYSGRVGTLLSATSNKGHIKQAVDCMFARGSTAGGAALKMAYQTARDNFIDDGINRIIMTTDGDFNVGTTGTEQLKDIVAKERISGVTLTMLGYGSGNYREEIMEGIANVGNGNYAYIDSALEAQKVMNEELSSTLFTIAKDVKLQLEFNPAYVAQYRLIGYENRILAEEDFANDKVDAGDIGASHQVTALYEIVPTGTKGWLPDRRYKANIADATGAKNSEMGFLKLRYKLPDSDTSSLIEHPLKSNLMAASKAPQGDMAFAIAVGAFGQKLRGDKYMGDYSFDDIAKLAGKQDIFWRNEFIKLTNIASSIAAPSSSAQ